MPTIIRATERNRGVHGVAYNLNDMNARAERYLNEVRAEAGKIVAEARREAEKIRRRAAEEGRAAGRGEIEKMVQGRLANVLPALGQAVKDIQHAKHAWLKRWEATAVHVAAAIAGRVIRRELTRQPEIRLQLVREALELASGNSQLRIRLNPDDHQSIAKQVKMLTDELAPLAAAEIIPDPEITPGGCRVETRFGAIDQQIEKQLERIEEELA